MKATYQQRIIYEAVGELGSHPQAEHVYEHVKQKHPTISRATVFRNLGQLAETGKLLNIGKIDGVTRYDHNLHNHYHFECRICKCVSDMNGYISDMHKRVECPVGFEVDEHVLHFRGVCAQCK